MRLLQFSGLLSNESQDVNAAPSTIATAIEIALTETAFILVERDDTEIFYSKGGHEIYPVEGQSEERG